VIDDPYTEFNREDMILRDWLALDRTVLANKRTFLAYARTTIALMVLGIAFIKLINHEFFIVTGFVLMALGAVVFWVGASEFAQNTRRFKRLVEKERAMEARIAEKEQQEKDTKVETEEEQQAA